jgi:hypothetical protein
MNIRVEVVCSDADSNEQRREVLRIERQDLAMETLGLNLSEGKGNCQDWRLVVSENQKLGMLSCSLAHDLPALPIS